VLARKRIVSLDSGKLDMMTKLYIQELKEAKRVADEELRMYVEEVSNFSDSASSDVLQKCVRYAQTFLSTQAEALLGGGSTKATQEIVSLLHSSRGLNRLPLTKVEERAVSKLLIIIRKFSRLAGCLVRPPFPFRAFS
jgi:hypothetical protein